MGYRVVRLCAKCARKVEREGTGFLILHELTYTWRGRPVTGLFCWHEKQMTLCSQNPGDVRERGPQLEQRIGKGEE